MGVDIEPIEYVPELDPNDSRDKFDSSGNSMSNQNDGGPGTVSSSTQQCQLLAIGDTEPEESDEFDNRDENQMADLSVEELNPDEEVPV